MSSELSPGTKAENAVYAGFGVALGLMIFRIFNPTIFLDIRGLVAAALLSASIIGALFFYGRPERGLIWLYRKFILRRSLLKMSEFLIRVRSSYKVWYRSISEDWMTIQEECDYALESAMKGVDLYDDVWKLRGGFYFALGIIPLLASITLEVGIPIVTIPLELSWLLFLICEAIISLALVIDFWSFPSRCSAVAMFRMLQDVHSIVSQQFVPLPELPSGSSYLGGHVKNVPPNIVIPGESGTIERALEEIDVILSRREWKRFELRFGFVIQDSRFGVNDIRRETELYYLQALLLCYQESEDKESLIERVKSRVLMSQSEKQARLIKKFLATKTDTHLPLGDVEEIHHRQLFEIGNVLTNQSEINHFQDQIVQSLWFIVNTSPESVELEEIQTVQLWYSLSPGMIVKPLVKIVGRFMYQDACIFSTKMTENPSRHQVAIDLFETIKDHENTSIWELMSPNLLKWIVNQNDSKLNHILVYAPWVKGSELITSILKQLAISNDDILKHFVWAYRHFVTEEFTHPDWLLHSLLQLLKECETEKILLSLLDLLNHINPETRVGVLQIFIDVISMEPDLVLQYSNEILKLFESNLLNLINSDQDSIEAQILAKAFLDSLTLKSNFKAQVD